MRPQPRSRAPASASRCRTALAFSILRDSSARLRILRGDVAGGLAELLDAGRRFESVGSHNPAFIAWRSPAALAMLQLGEEEEARRLATRRARARAHLGRSPRARRRSARNRADRGRRARAGIARGGGAGARRIAGEARACEGAHRAGSCAAEGQPPRRRRVSTSGTRSSWRRSAARRRSPRAPSASSSPPAPARGESP